MSKVIIKTGEEEIVKAPIIEGGTGTDDNPILNSDGKTDEEIDATGEAAKSDDLDNISDKYADKDKDTINAIEIDGEEYILSETGDALNTDKTVKYTKAELDAFDEASGESAVALLSKTTNIIPIDSDGVPIEYSDDDAGLAKYVSDVYDQGRSDSNKEFNSTLYNKYPVLQNIINHLELNNGDLTNFNNTVSYKDIDIDKKDETQMKSIIFAARKLRGEDSAKTEKYYNYLKDSDVDMKAVISESADELNYLKQIEEEETNRTQEQLDAKATADAESLKDYWGIEVKDGKVVDLNKEGSVYKSIKSGTLTLGDEKYIIPEKIRVKVGDKVEYKTRDDFFKYVYQPVTQIVNGQKVTQTAHITDMQAEMSARSTGHDIFDAFKRYVKYDNTQFIKEQVAKANMKTITKRLTTNSKSNTSTSKALKTGKIIIKN